jgi:hypothetical protein
VAQNSSQKKVTAIILRSAKQRRLSKIKERSAGQYFDLVAHQGELYASTRPYTTPVTMLRASGMGRSIIVRGAGNSDIVFNKSLDKTALCADMQQTLCYLVPSKYFQGGVYAVLSCM